MARRKTKLSQEGKRGHGKDASKSEKEQGKRTYGKKKKSSGRRGY